MNSESASQSQLKQLLILAWPVIVSRSTQVIDGLADALMIAHLGEAALAATTTGALNSYALFIFPMGIAFVIASFSSQLTGRKDPAGARRYGWYGMGLAAGSQLMMFALLPFLTPLMQWFDYDADVEKAMTLYLSIRLLSTGASVGIEALGNYYGGTGNTAILMRINLLSMVLNIFFNWLLIDGHLGFPAMGVAGAAWSSVLSTGIAFVLFLAKFLWDGRQFGRLGLSWREFGRLLGFGAPSGFNFSFEFFAFLGFVNIVVAGLGTVSLAAMMAVMQLNSFAFMPAIGIGSAGAILVGQAIGRKEKHLVPGLLKLTFLVTAVWMCLVGVAYIVLPGPLLVHFTPAGESGARFFEVGVRMLILSAFWQLFDAAGITISETLRAAGDTAFTMWVRGFLAWLVFLPGSWISVRYFGGNEMTALLWLLIYLGLLALALFLRFRSGAWRKIELVEEAPVV